MGSFKASRNIVSGVQTVNSFTATAPGTGFDIAGAVTSYVEKRNGEIISTFLIDLVGLVCSNGATHAIGVASTNPAYFTRVTTAINGLVYSVEMVCLEVPTTGDPDVDLAANSNGTLYKGQAAREDADHELITAGGAHTLALMSESPDDGFIEGGIQNDYLYLAQGGTTAGTYDAGKFAIRLFGYDPSI